MFLYQHLFGIKNQMPPKIHSNVDKQKKFYFPNNKPLRLRCKTCLQDSEMRWTVRTVGERVWTTSTISSVSISTTKADWIARTSKTTEYTAASTSSLRTVMGMLAIFHWIVETHRGVAKGGNTYHKILPCIYNIQNQSVRSNSVLGLIVLSI